MEEGKAYIESGILELYVLGQLTAQEQAEVEAMAVQYPEVKQEIDAIERAMEQYAVAQAVQPAEGLDQKILTRITWGKQNTPGTPEIPAKETGKAQEARIVPLNKPIDYETRIRTLRIALVACVALLVVSAVALFSAHTELGSAKVQIAELSQDKEKFTTTVNFMKQTNAELQKIADMTTDPNWKFVKLAGTPMDPEASMMVYWHTTGKHVMMDNSKMKLPATDKAHQYQLWALVNGKPVDLGVFDVKAGSSQILISMKDIASAQTFAVTLEKRGGSPSPTMTQMIVAGNVAI
ncbi:MAG TPA: anti-sigma factor [Pedobacter sp.]|uniref:anti-sigma factor n=1 Tax=Pedobacter sp. TaxID=1411316 RepID=UPI002B54AF08|nr:anti-sigma factor [Pedobacter sp.]HMI04987.1 anti-sigma factor [Pedobacter sp.]